MDAEKETVETEKTEESVESQDPTKADYINRLAEIFNEILGYSNFSETTKKIYATQANEIIGKLGIEEE